MQTVFTTTLSNMSENQYKLTREHYLCFLASLYGNTRVKKYFHYEHAYVELVRAAAADNGYRAYWVGHVQSINDTLNVLSNNYYRFI
jgi:hypothetical protein